MTRYISVVLYCLSNISSAISNVPFVYVVRTSCQFRRTEKGYPLNIETTTIKYEESPVDKEFLLNLLPKINYNALVAAVKQMSPHCEEPLPELPETMDVSNAEQNKNLDDVTIANLHKVLFDVYLVEGWLICPDTGRKFPVKESIPNMILHEDEI